MLAGELALAPRSLGIQLGGTFKFSAKVRMQRGLGFFDLLLDLLSEGQG